MVLISFLGVMAIPFMMFIESLQTHLKHPNVVFTLSDIYSDSILYIMLLSNIMIYVAITAYLFSREYTENTLKNILPIPISRTKLLLGKFFTLLVWTFFLSFVTWAGILILSGVYHVAFEMKGYNFTVAIGWLPKFFLSSLLMFLTVFPFAFIAQNTKGFVVPMIVCAVVVMGNAALCNQDLGAIYPWTATFFLLDKRIEGTGYPIELSVAIIMLVSVIGFYMTFRYFKKEDLK